MNTRIELLGLSLSIVFASATMAQSYEPPRTASGKPDFQGNWTNAALTTMQRASSYEDVGLVIPPAKIEEFTANHHQNVRQATDDGQVQGELPTGEDLGEGRGYNAAYEARRERLGLLTLSRGVFHFPNREIYLDSKTAQRFLAMMAPKVAL
jgi:hypothetical protein